METLIKLRRKKFIPLPSYLKSNLIQEHKLTTCFSSRLFLFSRSFMRALASLRAASNWPHLFRTQRYTNLLKFSNNRSTFYSLFSFLKHPHEFWCPACDLLAHFSAVSLLRRAVVAWGEKKTGNTQFCLNLQYVF